MSSKKRKRQSDSKVGSFVADIPVVDGPVAAFNESGDPPSAPAAMSLNLDPTQSSGWHAIDAVLAKSYPGANAAHFASPLPLAFGGSDPLNAISAYYVSPLNSDVTSNPDNESLETSLTDSSPPSSHHWHFVTYGFSELFEKSPENDHDVSGYGFELTMRLSSNDTRQIAEQMKNRNSLAVQASASPPLDVCPTWAVEFLQSLARYVWATGTKFDVGHHMCLNGTLGAPPNAPETGLDPPKHNNMAAIIFVEDPILKQIQTPNGSVKFLQIVGVTQDEYELNWETSVPFVSELISETFGHLLITRLARPSILTNPTIKARALHKAQTDSSIHSSLYNRQIHWRITQVDEHSTQKMNIQIGANIVPQFLAILKRRLPYGNTFTCVGTDQEYSCAIVFQPDKVQEAQGPKTKKSKLRQPKTSLQLPWSISPQNEHIIEMSLQAEDIKLMIDTIKPVQGIYDISPHLGFSVVPTYIKDATTSAPIKIIGE